MKKLIVLTFSVALLASAAVASASTSTTLLPPNHHIHDCTAAPCVYPHLAVGFFPRILGQSLGTYLEDPAVWNDATDKALLPGDAKPEWNQPLRAGVCSTSTMRTAGTRRAPRLQPLVHMAIVASSEGGFQ
jgi:hypothetical protein